MPAVLHVADPAGPPMAKIRPSFKGPGMPQALDVTERNGQLVRRRPASSAGSSRTEGPAQFVFLYVDRPELVEDFLHPPTDAGKEGVAAVSLHATRSGKERTYDWPLDGQAGQVGRAPRQRPDRHASTRSVGFPLGQARASAETLGETIPMAQFKVRKGGGPEV